MDYLNMEKENFYKILEKYIYNPVYEEWLNLDIEYQKYRSLTESNTLFDRIDKELKNTKLDFNIKKKCNFIKDNYPTFRSLDSFCDVLVNSEKYTDQEKSRIYGRIPYYISLTKKNYFNLLLNVFPVQRRDIIEYLYTIERTNNSNIVNNNLNCDPEDIKKDVILLKKIGTFLKTSKNFKKNCIYLYDVLGIDHGNLEIKSTVIKKIYVKSIVDLKDEYGISNKIDLQDLYYVDKYIKEYNKFDFKYECYFQNRRSSFQSLRETLKHYCSIIGNYIDSDKKIDIINEIVEKHKLLLTHFDVFFEGDYKRYVHAVLTGAEPKNDFKVADIFNIEEFYDDYKLLLRSVYYGHLYMDRFGKDETKIIDISKKARFFNNMNPSNVKQAITKGKINISSYELNCLNKYIDEYSVEYFDKTKIKNTNKKEVVAMPKSNYLEKYELKIQDYLDSKIYDINEYLEYNDIDKKDFDRAVEILKKEKSPLYDQYIEKSHDAAKKFKKKNQEDADKMTKLLKSGIKTDKGNTRDFDLIDYYQITKVTPEELFNSIANKQPTKATTKIDKVLARFLKSYIYDSRIYDIDKLHKHSFSFELDENNNPIFVSETEEDRLKAIEFLNENQIPITQGTYRAIIRRIIRDKYSEKNRQKVKN